MREQVTGKVRDMEINYIFKWLKSLPMKLAAIIAFLLIWEIAPIVGLVNPVLIPPPSSIAMKLLELLLSGELLTHISTSMKRVFIGYGLAVIVALPLGFLLGGWFSIFETVMDPLFQVLGQANPFTLFPVFIALLGIGEISKIAIIFWVCQWPILFNTVSGIRNVDPLLIKVAKSIELSKYDMFIKVLVPAALPSIFTGLRLSAVFSLFMLIGAEMIGSQSGLGFMIIQSQATFQMTKMYAGIVTVAMLGILINQIMILIETKTTK
jgi:NitT/TauT family transport system permease protein